MELTNEQVTQICKGDEDIEKWFHALLDQNRELKATVERQAKEIETLKTRVRELERQLGQNSNNSSKPPSSDGFRKPTNLRTPGGKKGAPRGHDGHTLRFHSQPDHTLVHKLTSCAHCSASLEGVAPEGCIKRQVFDLPFPQLQVTEHQAEQVCCPHCQTRQHASFPKGIEAPTQYGDGFASWTAYLNVFQLLPLQRIAQFYADLTGCRPSEGTLLSQIERMATSIEAILPTIRANLLQQPVLHADETGLRVKGKQHWLHTVSDARWTLYSFHPKRGSEGMEKIGVLPTYPGIVVHDCFGSYFKPEYSFEHALCNVHLLRECKGIEQYDKHRWPSEMKELLSESWKLAKAARSQETLLAEAVIGQIGTCYDDILRRGKAEWDQDPVPAKTGPRGRKSKSKAANLGERFRDYKAAILRFLRDARVPFDNNQAERDIRMTKVKMKISGTFRTETSGEQFAAIRSFISTLLKQGLPIHASLLSVLRGQFSF